MTEKPIIITGAGLAGSLLAIYLARRGFRVAVYERRSDMRRAEISAGRSINLALSVRGIHALAQVNLAKKVLDSAIPMYGRMIHDPTGKLTFQRYGKDDSEAINSTSRGGLNCTLMDVAEQDHGVSFFFNERCEDVDLPSGELQFVNEVSGERTVVRGATILGCDGSYSAVRLAMQKYGRFNFQQAYLEHGYKELTIPAGPHDTFLVEKNALHIWPRGTFMLIALPNLDGSFTCTLFFPFEGEKSFASLDTPDRVEQFFRETFTDAVPLLPALRRDFFDNPTGSLVTVKCAPWHVGGTALLLGDSAHAIVPFYGQGMNAAFEDCLILDGCIETHGDDWARVFSAFQALRKVDADAIADLALENFIEMRDSVADPVFLRKKELELMLEAAFPGEYLSKYSMVTFHRTAYSEAHRIGNMQNDILMEMCASMDSLDGIDLPGVFRALRREMTAREHVER